MFSSFGPASTTDEVLREIDLTGRRVLVTGATSGLGLETARSLLAHGATVVGTSRELTKAQSAARTICSKLTRDVELEFVELDLGSLASVRRCANQLQTGAKPFDVVIANAGLMAGPKTETAEGIEAQFGVNFLGHFVLVNRIRDRLLPGARVVIVSSAGHRRTNVDLADPNFKSTPYDSYTAYGRSKTALIQFAVEFDRRHKAEGIRAIAVHPGAIQTETVQKLIDGLGEGKEAALAQFDWKSQPQGAATTVWAGFVADVDDAGGKYCEDCHVAEVDDNPVVKRGVRSYALDAKQGQDLWKKAEELAHEHFADQ